MAYRNKIITNPKTGQQIKFLQTSKDTGGKLLEMEASWRPGSTEPPAHYHPNQEEIFTVLEGSLQVKINGVIKNLSIGETLQIPANTVHTMWNPSPDVTRVNWKVSPAMDTEYFLENTIGLAAAGKTNEAGMPKLLQVAVIARNFSNVFRLARPTFLIQSVVFALLSPFAALKGYKATYPEFID